MGRRDSSLHSVLIDQIDFRRRAGSIECLAEVVFAAETGRSARRLPSRCSRSPPTGRASATNAPPPFLVTASSGGRFCDSQPAPTTHLDESERLEVPLKRVGRAGAQRVERSGPIRQVGPARGAEPNGAHRRFVVRRNAGASPGRRSCTRSDRSHDDASSCRPKTIEPHMSARSESMADRLSARPPQVRPRYCCTTTSPPGGDERRPRSPS